LVDFEIFTMGYPELIVSGGKNSKIQIKYAEALYEAVHLKAHRDSVNGLSMFGVWDIFHPDGETRTFRPLWKRTFRYVQFNIETKSEPLEILSYQLEYSGYPYPEMATFESDNSRLNEIFEMSKRTLRMCSGETYYDTPFYEQLSYGGDNRPIAAISTYNSNDDRLLREVLRLYPQSENKETGLFKSAYPSRFDFDMGSWSMGWIQTLHDYYFMRGDSAFVKQFSGKIDGVLRFYERHLDEQTGMIGTVKNQNFIDWSNTKGSLPRPNEMREMKQSALLTLYFAHTLDCTAKLYNELGLKEKAEHWNNFQKESNQRFTLTAGMPKSSFSAIMPTRKFFRNTPTSWPFYAICYRRRNNLHCLTAS
jgi:alpha-L-rhamnosidase